ncbi:MAG: hypothetical protein QOI41_6134, partial [Myxococcales bacterium]|nr:hypothetical protein [Myxococcales bacterium]
MRATDAGVGVLQRVLPHPGWLLR